MKIKADNCRKVIGDRNDSWEINVAFICLREKMMLKINKFAKHRQIMREIKLGRNI